MTDSPAPSPSVSPGQSRRPKVLRVSLGGFGPNWEVKYLGKGRLRYAYSAGALFDRSGTIVEPTPAQWEQFWRELSTIGFWDWAGEYLPKEDILDGLCWSLEVAVAGQSLISRGDNAYPGGQHCAYDKNSEFYLFLAALARLTGCRKLVR